MGSERKRKKQKKQQQNNQQSKYIHFIFYAVITLVVVFIYGKTKSYDFAIDDKIIIVQNVYVNEGFKSFPKLIEAAFNNDMSVPGVTRPLSMFTHALDVSMFGMDAGSHHQMNLLYYLLLGFALFYLLMKYLLKEYPPFLALGIVLLFLSHPVHVESVANIKGRDDILSFLFGVISIILFYKNLDERKIYQQIMIFLGLLFSFLSKETGIIFVILIPLTYYYFKPVKLAQALSQTYGYLIFGAILILLRFLMFIPPPEYINIYNNSILAINSPLDQIMMTFRIMLHYLTLNFWPSPLIWDYSYGHFEMNSSTYLWAIISIVLYLGMLVFGILSFNKKSIIGFGFLFFLIALAPVSNLFIKIATTFGERLLLIPSFGMVLAFVFFIKYGLDKIFTAQVSNNYFRHYGIIGFTILVFSIMSTHRVSAWENDDVLIAIDSKYSKSIRSSKAYIQYLTSIPDPALVNHKKALEVCKDGLDRFPNEWELWYFRGVIQTKLNHIEDAKLAYEKSLEINPNKFITIVNYANFFLEEDPVKAINLFKKAVSVKKDDPRIIGNLAIMLHKNGQLLEAKTYYEQAINLDYQDKNMNQAYQILLNTLENN